MSTLKVKYVGAKDRETDTVAGTGIEWVGKGDIQTVPASAWSVMAKHADVWELVDEASEEPKPSGKTLGDADPKPEGDKQPDDGLDGKTKEELHAIAKERGVKVHPASGQAKVIEALRAAAEA